MRKSILFEANAYDVLDKDAKKMVDEFNAFCAKWKIDAAEPTVWDSDPGG